MVVVVGVLVNLNFCTRGWSQSFPQSGKDANI